MIRRAAAYLESGENLRIFRGRYIVGTLTNNANIIIYYYLLPSRLSTDPKIVYMTLNDLEILHGHFTLNFYYYEPRFSN